MAVERHLWNRWIAANDPAGLLRAERRRADAGGNWLLGFLYVDHEAGLTIRVLKWARKTWLGKLDETGAVPRDEMLVVRHGLLEQLEVAALNDRELGRFRLPPEPEWLEAYSRPELETLRSDAALDVLRAPGFPDDLKVALVDTPSGSVEFAWARAERRRPSGAIECVLLNEPRHRYRISAGDRILIEIMRYGSIVTAVCSGPAAPQV